MTLQPRIFPDFAAVPTRRERNVIRGHFAALQGELFAELAEPIDASSCPVCTGPHAEQDCRLGTAPTLELEEPNSEYRGHRVCVYAAAAGWTAFVEDVEACHYLPAFPTRAEAHAAALELVDVLKLEQVTP